MNFLSYFRKVLTGRKGYRLTINHKKYKYSPLSEEAGEIRLLALLPGALSEKVEIELHIYQFKPDLPVPSYQALSYAWGDARKRHRVCIKDPGGSKYLWLTRNLAEALPYLRHETKALLFWIDAICVNQKDLDERSSQVKRMAEIYSQASNVVVWLGRAGDGSDYVMDLAARIGPNVDPIRATAGPFPNLGVDLEKEDRWWFKNGGDEPEDYPSRNMMILALENMFDRPWFKRLWVWQEVILARKATILCGSRNLAWFDFRKFLLVFTLHNSCNLSRKARKNLTHITYLCYYKYPKRLSAVAELMKYTRACECSDDRDRLYGTFNLLSQDDANVVKIEPNYSKPVSEIYREFARANYEKAGDLDIMKFCKTIPKKVKAEGSLPSWVPDWTSLDLAKWFEGTRFATGHSKAHVSSTTSDGNLLEVTGKYCAIIDSKKELPQLDTSGKSKERVATVQQAIIEIAPKGVLCQQYAPMREKTLLEAFTRTIHIAFADDYWPHSNVDTPFLAAQNVVANCLQKTELSIKDRGAEKKVLRQMWTNFHDRSFFTTEEGHVGLAPDTAAPGDVLVVLLGLDAPIILRPTTNGCYNVVGTCYVYGLMSSEALLGPLPVDTRIVRCPARSVSPWPYAFFDDKTQRIKTDDPRLGPLPQGWHFAPASVCKEKNRYPLFCREDTGEVKKFDPRLTPEALKERDPQLDLRVFKLI